MTKRFYIFLSGITAFRLIYAIFLPLAPQEAYYWNYSRHLDLSYFDHPPMAAYFIKLTTLLGTSAFSIHLAAILLSVPMTIAVYRLASMLFDERVGFWSAVTINLTFIYAIGAMIITPDCPLLLFWILSMIACYMIAKGGARFWWILLGIFLGAGFASKYSIAFAGLGALIFFASGGERRRWLLTPWPYIALVSSILVALPVIYWNYAHDWASFAFQSTRRAGEMTRLRPDFFFGYIGTIVGIYGIVPLPLLIASIWDVFKKGIRPENPQYSLLASFSIPLVVFLLPLSLIYWIKMNWTAPAFIGWFIAAVAYYFANQHREWVRIWGKVSFYFVLISFVLVSLAVPLSGLFLGSDSFFANWEKLGARVQKIGADMERPYFIAGSEYKISSQLAFHLPDHPETVGGHVIGRDGLQYRYWADPDTLLGYNAIFVFYPISKEVERESELQGYFETVLPREEFTIYSDGQYGGSYYIYRCYNYLGLKRSDN